MGSFANSLFTFMLGWLQTAVKAIWNAFTTADGKSMLAWIGEHWLLLAGILCVTGAAADLSVYIIRWKPHRVWKSFFNRIRRKDNDEEPETEEAVSPEEKPEPVRTRTETRRKYSTGKETERAKAPDFSQWESRTQVIGVQKDISETHRPRPATVTNAGYVVPDDSPYRRPETAAPGQDIPARQSSAAGAVHREDGYRPEEQIRSRYRNRRRINVGELFSNPEDELKEFDAPQHLIDRKKAYHEPVYPRGWKKNEDDGE